MAPWEVVAAYRIVPPRPVREAPNRANGQGGSRGPDARDGRRKARIVRREVLDHGRIDFAWSDWTVLLRAHWQRRRKPCG